MALKGPAMQLHLAIMERHGIPRILEEAEIRRQETETRREEADARREAQRQRAEQEKRQQREAERDP